jgi:hypothetical protein
VAFKTPRSYGSACRRRSLSPIVTHATGGDAARKEKRLRNTYLRRKVKEKIARLLTKKEIEVTAPR